jgi:hypothetical protein
MRSIAADAGSTQVRRSMWILLLEAGVAAGLLVFIVWWTWPKSDDKNDSERK